MENGERPPVVSKETAREMREEKRIDMAKKALDRFNVDPDYRFLHERISDLFADRLKSDLQSFNSGNMKNIGLSAKWCPSIDSSFDRSTLLCETITRKLFPKDSLFDRSTIPFFHFLLYHTISCSCVEATMSHLRGVDGNEEIGLRSGLVASIGVPVLEGS